MSEIVGWSIGELAPHAHASPSSSTSSSLQQVGTKKTLKSRRFSLGAGSTSKKGLGNVGKQPSVVLGASGTGASFGVPPSGGKSPLMEWCPTEVMDMILGDCVLNERDHLALAATCKAFRHAYMANDLWAHITAARPLRLPGHGSTSLDWLYTDNRHTLYCSCNDDYDDILAERLEKARVADARVRAIFSRAPPRPAEGVERLKVFEVVEMQHDMGFYAWRLGKGPYRDGWGTKMTRVKVFRGAGHEMVIERVNKMEIDRMEARDKFGLSLSQVNALPRFGGKVLLARVEALALRVHATPQVLEEKPEESTQDTNLIEPEPEPEPTTRWKKLWKQRSLSTGAGASTATGGGRLFWFRGS